MYFRHPALLLLCLAAATTARADLVNIPSSRDNTLYEDPLGSVSNGAGDSIFVGEIASLKARRGLLYFDLAAAIPAGAHIDSVSLRLQVTRTRYGPTPVDIYPVLADWGEGTSSSNPGGAGSPAMTNDATWLDRKYGLSQPWSTPGGDFSSTVLSTLSVGSLGSYTWPSTTAFAAQAQSWLDAPAGNFGILLKGNELTMQTAKRFGSRENINANYRPALIVNYTIPAPGSAILLAAALAPFTRRRRN